MRGAPIAEKRVGPLDAIQRLTLALASDNVEAIHGLSPGTFEGTFEAFARNIHSQEVVSALASVEGHAAEHEKGTDKGVRS